MEFRTLNTGYEIPVIGFGTMRVKNLEEMIPEAVKAGYRLIDTAANYDNEKEVGAGIRLAMEQTGIKREDLFVTSKMQILTDGTKHTRQAVETSLSNLGLDYLDLYLIHQPYGDIYGEWRELEKLQKEGLIRSIGVSNFEPFRLMDLMLHNEMVPAVNQVEINPWYQEEKERLFHEEHGICTEAWSPLAQNRMNLFEQTLLTALAEKYKKTVPQIILRWITQRGIVAIPRSKTPEHAISNFDIFDFQLTETEMESMKELDTGHTTSLDHLDPEIVKLLSDVVANPIEVGQKISADEWAKMREKR